tara:strand:+ start:881 stop:1045 length:165 start_codon:yes stop_codon:yes gene_type:complete
MGALEKHICPTIVDIEGIQSINWGHVKMARKPLKDLFDEQSELYDREFEDDAKL